MIQRMGRHSLVALSLLSLCSAALCATEELRLTSAPQWSLQDDMEQMEVDSIQIETTRSWPGDGAELRALRERLKTRPGALFSQAILDADLKLLAEQFEVVAPEMVRTSKGIQIQIFVTPRPLLRKVEVVGNERLGRRRLLRELGLTEQTPLDRKALADGVQKVREAYIKKGFFEALVDAQVIPVGDGAEVEVRLQVFEGRSGRIWSIRFENFSPEEQSEALSKLNLKTWFMLTSWATQDGTFRPDMAEFDRLQVLQVLQNAGYADAKLRLEVAEVPGKDRLVVTFVADKGQLYTVGSLSFQGNTLFSNREIWAQFLLRPDAPFSPEKLRETAQNLKDLYGAKGYIEAEVNFRTSLDPDRPVYNIDLRIKENEPFRVGMIRIFGNQWTQPRVILRECVLMPGEVFDSRLLKATERRLQNIGYFKTVNVYAVKTPSQGGLGDRFRDVYIEVEEAQTGVLRWNYGYGTAEGATLSMEVGERNFYLAGLRNVGSEGIGALRGGGEYFHLEGTKGTKQNQATLSWLNPSVWDSLWRFGVEGVLSKDDLQSNDLDTTNQSLTARASYPWNAYLAGTLRYRYGKQWTVAARMDGDDVRVEPMSGTISAVAASLALDTTNRPWDPTTGLRSELLGEYAGIGGTSQWWKLFWGNVLYMNVWPIGVFKLRFDLNFAYPFGRTESALQMPYNERFFLGGDQTVRGYVPFSIGPQGRNGPLGGASSGLASIEYSISFWEQWRVFGFIDAGQVELERFKLNWPWRFSVGFGMTVPILTQGPMTVGLGFPINPERPTDVKRLFFTMGAAF